MVCSAFIIQQFTKSVKRYFKLLGRRFWKLISLNLMMLPMILPILLGVFVLSGILTLILGLVISVSNPFLGAMYTFFFSNVIGKQISKAIFSSAVLCFILYLMEQFGLVVIIITPAALLTYICNLLGGDLSLATIIVFGTRIFSNGAAIRRLLLTKKIVPLQKLKSDEEK